MNLEDINFSQLSVRDTLLKLEVPSIGLSKEEAQKRIKEIGQNKLPEKKNIGWFFLFLIQFKSSLIYILFIAAFISWKFEHYVDAYIILVILFINAIIGFFQRGRTEKILEALKKMVTISARVVRDGVEIKILAENLTLGDIVILEAGDRVPADMRVLESRNVLANESSLTGESTPVEKDSLPVIDIIIGEYPKNYIFMGTNIVSGYVRGVVVSVGIKTRLGGIAEEIKEIKSGKGHFEKKIDELVIHMGGWAIFGALVTFIIGFYFKGLEFFDIFLFSVASLVALVPEGLPAVLTIVLAVGASRMAKKNVIIKNLPSVETLGVANVICTDKTGTLTENILTVERIFIGSKLINVSGVGMNIRGEFFLEEAPILPKYFPDLIYILKSSLYSSDASVLVDGDDLKTIGEPVEIAMEILAKKGVILKSDILKNVNILDKIAFDTQDKYKANLINLGSEGHPNKKIFVSGAFEVILEKSTCFYEDGEVKNLTKEKKEEILKYALDMAGDALKVVGFAFKDASKEKVNILKNDISNLVFIGFFGMIDPPRQNVKEAIARCKSAGIRILMLTGDHKDTAVAVAKKINLIPNEAHEEGRVVTESDLRDISEEEFKKVIEKAIIFARVTPETKLRVVRALQDDGHIVAVTGDGINDAPALKQADIGIAMGITGTDVAKEASEIILIDDNFASIVDAILEGRTVFSNVKKTSFYLVSTNIAEGATIVTALVSGLSLPLLPIQLLWLNLVTEGLVVVALAVEPNQIDILNKKPKPKNEKVLSRDVLPLLFFTSLLMIVGTIILFSYFMPHGIDKARTIAFSFMAFSQLFNVLNMRSLTLSIFKIGFFSNKFMIFALIFSVGIQLMVIYIPFFQNIFSFENLNLRELILIIVSSSLIIFVVEIYKIFKRRSLRLKDM
ncbi:MAG: HAD-IC family P-type ATPase [Patescibacteria group bacterium]